MPDRPDTALIVVDMQNAFTAPTGGPAVHGADRVVSAVNTWVDRAVDHGWPVFYTRDIAPSELPAGDPDKQTDLDAGVRVRGTVVPKGPGQRGRFSGFVLTRDAPGAGGLSALPALLREAQVASVVVTGLAADVCVAATAQDARRLGYHVTVALDATAFVHAHPDGDTAALDELRDAGITISDASS